VEKMSLDLEDQEDAGSDITTNLGHRWGTVYLFHRLAEGIWQFNEPDWYRSQRKLVMSGTKVNWVTNFIWTIVLKYYCFVRRQ